MLGIIPVVTQCIWCSAGPACSLWTQHPSCTLCCHSSHLLHYTYYDLIDYRSLHSLTSHSSLKVSPSLSSSEVVIMLIPNPKGKYCVFLGCCMVVLSIYLFLLTVSFTASFSFFNMPYLLFIYTHQSQHLVYVLAYYIFMLYYTIHGTG